MSLPIDTASVDLPHTVGSAPTTRRLELHTEVSAVLTVKYLVTPLADLEGFQQDADAASAAARLAQLGFDAAPVWDGETLIGRVWRSNLEHGKVGDHTQPIAPDFVISAGAPISGAMRWLLHDPWLLVVEGRGFIGIVTPSDLNRHAVRTYFYLLLGELEMRLSEVVRRHLADEEILGMIQENRRGDVESRLAELRAGNVDSGVVEALNLTDLVRLGQQSSEIRSDFGVRSKTRWKNLTGPIPDFRHDIMHLVRPMLGGRSGLAGLIRQDERLRTLLG